MSTIDIGTGNLALAYLLLALPLALMLWLRLPLISETLIAALRMTLQLLFVGFYLQWIFALNSLPATGLWILMMLLVADLAIIRGANLRFRAIAGPVFVALLIGTLLPLLFFLLIILARPEAMAAQYVIPICGMILGNCLRADIIGIRTFYEALRREEKSYLYSLAQGAMRQEALQPFTRKAFQAAMQPTVSSMATIGLVALPGMMTGVILGGGDPMTAIKYQLAIMIAIYAGTALTVISAIRLTAAGNISGRGRVVVAVFATDGKEGS